MVNRSLLNYNELFDQYEETKDCQIKFRLLILLNYCRGKSGPEISDIFHISHDQVYYWIHRYIDEGITGLHDKDRPGRPAKIDYDELSETLQKSPSEVGIDKEEWDIDAIHQYIHDQQKIDISKKYIYEVLKKIGYDLKQEEKKSITKYPDLRTREGRILTSLHIEVMGDAEILLEAPIHRIITDKGIRPVFSIIDSSKRSTTIQGKTEHGLLTIKYEEFRES